MTERVTWWISSRRSAEVTVQRGIADADASSDFVEGEVAPLLDEHLAGRRDDPLPVALGIGAQARLGG
ncbi:hypothetical protein GCM10020221_06270 [Streptomyces thioluteus]|uniref:Uncharacterized protein n=1 Tax=Streptomyces thioluteus TaxID=66431 RepID=A0ABN3WHE0_STRTU